MRVSVSIAPAAVSGLTDGTTYLVQNLGPREVHLVVADSEPSGNTDPALILADRDKEYVKPSTGESVYVWTREGASWVFLGEVG